MSDVDPRMTAAAPDDESGAVRLIFEYDGDDVKLVLRQPVDVTVEPSDPVMRGAELSGFWVELRAQSEEVLYRRVLSDPGRVYPEVFSPDPEVGIGRATEPQTAGAFTVLVPRQAAGSHVVLMNSTPAEGAAVPRMAPSQEAAAQEMARFSIEDDGAGAGSTGS